jgi:hypothetical protein
VATEYDAVTIQQQADELNAQGDRAAILAMIVGGIFGVLLGGIAFILVSERNEALSIVVALAIPLGSTFIGSAIGEGTALKLRSQAQQLLISLAIERNTRKEMKHGV